MKKRRKRTGPSPPEETFIPGTMAAYAEEYYEWLAVRNYSVHTVRNRRNYLTYFITWCGERGLLEPGEITKPVVERYQRYLYHYRKKRTKEPLSFRSQISRLIPVRTFFKWLAKRNYMLYNPASEIELPKIEKRLPPVLSLSEVEEVINQPDVRDPMGVRDRTILEVLYSTAMRRMELANLKLYDLDIDRGTITIREGKGKKDRVVPVGERAIAWLQKYLFDVRPTLAVEPDTGHLFLTALGDEFTTNRLTQLARNYVNASGVGKKGACHLFRHTCATLMLENGADVRYIQQLLGHARLDTTEIYTQVSIRKLKEIHGITHPSGKVRKDDTSGT